MQREHFNRRINPVPAHQTHHFQSQNPQHLPINNIFHPPNLPQFEPSNLLNNHPPTHYPYSSDDERRLRDEVIYLHSLWHRGPPGLPSTLSPLSQTPHFLKPSTPIPFKKSKIISKTLEPNLISDKEWPIESKPKSPSPSGSSWPAFKHTLAPVSRPATAEEQERVLAVKIQLKGLDSCAGLFHKEGVSDGEDEDEEEEDDVDDVEEFEFFMKLFEDNDELRSYYEKNCENGEFYCLVCGALGNKLGRKYKNCVALVQHAVTISKTKKRMAHRGYGHAICKVLGWDVNQLPSLPSTVGDASGQSVDFGGEFNNHADGRKDNSTVVEREENFANISYSEAGSRSKPDSIEMVNDCTAGAGCIASDVLESNAHVGGCEANGHEDLEKALLEQNNTHDSAQKDANNAGEVVDCGLLLTEDVAK